MFFPSIFSDGSDVCFAKRLCGNSVDRGVAGEFNTTPAYWVNLRTNYDMARAAKEIDVSYIEPFVAA